MTWFVHGGNSILLLVYYLHIIKDQLDTMIGNGKFEPLTLWNDIELKYRITASQWAF